MAPHRRHRIGASRRRRREDEGEDEGSIDGALEDDSLSEGSVLSHQDDDDADGEGSDASEDDASDSPQADKSNGQVNGRVHEAEEAPPEGRSASPGKRLFASTMSDTEAMMNGLKLSDGASEVAEIHFDDMKEEPDDQAGRTPSAPPPIESKRETFAERKLREHEEYIKERDENPAFVPTRGGFFLHDKRSTEPDTNGYKPSTKPKSRPYGLIVDGNVGRSVPPIAPCLFVYSRSLDARPRQMLLVKDHGRTTFTRRLLETSHQLQTPLPQHRLLPCLIPPSQFRPLPGRRRQTGPFPAPS